MKKCASWILGKADKHLRNESLLDLFNIKDPSMDRIALRNWTSRFDPYEEELDIHLQYWTEDSTRPTWFHEFLQTQIIVSNAIAREQRTACSFIGSGGNGTRETSRDRGAICTTEVREGDRIIWIMGLAQPLVVRPLPGSVNTVRIVGLLLYAQEGESWGDESNDDFVEYSIH
jgi:hypothetical protein